MIYGVDNTKLPVFDPTPADLYCAQCPRSLYRWKNKLGSRGYLKFNPAAVVEKRYEGKSNNLVSNATLTYDIYKGLLIRMQAGL